MSDTATQTAVPTTEERKPPTLADIVREKTDDGKRIIDFFLDVMEDRIDGAELCHRIDAAKQLEKHKSKAAAKFLAKYRGVSCGHSINGRPDPADPCSAAERSLVAVTLNAPATLTRDFLTVLSGIDEFLMARLIRAQTADAGTIIDFLDDVMQDRNDGFKTHHRIAAAKELIVHIVRDEQPAPNTPVVPAESLPRTRYGAGTQGGGGGRSAAANPARTDPVERVEGSVHPEPGSPEPVERVEGSRPEFTEGGPTSIHPEPVEGSVHPEPRQIVIPAEAGTHPPDPVLSAVKGSAHPEPVERVEGSRPEFTEGSLTSVHPEPGSPEPVERVEGPVLSTAEGPRPEFTEGPVLSTAEGPADSSSVVPAKEPTEGRQDYEERKPRTRRTRTQRRREGAARSAIRRKALGSERIEEEKDEKPAPVELTPAERRIRERLEQHWHEPDPHGAPIDSTHPGRSPPS